MVLDGKIADPSKCAHSAEDALRRFLPIFERQYDELRGAHAGTINVDLRAPFDLEIDFKTDLIEMGSGIWHRAEFVRVWFEFPPGTNAKAWIYQPYGWHWGQGKDDFLELLVSKHVEGIEAGKSCKIHVLNEGWGSSSTTDNYFRKHPV
jgi:hypothetical protein